MSLFNPAEGGAFAPSAGPGTKIRRKMLDRLAGEWYNTIYNFPVGE